MYILWFNAHTRVCNQSISPKERKIIIFKSWALYPWFLISYCSFIKIELKVWNKNQNNDDPLLPIISSFSSSSRKAASKEGISMLPNMFWVDSFTSMSVWLFSTYMTFITERHDYYIKNPRILRLINISMWLMRVKSIEIIFYKAFMYFYARLWLYTPYNVRMCVIISFCITACIWWNSGVN